MALMYCPECGHQVSTHAPACPSCGKPNRLLARPAIPPEQTAPPVVHVMLTPPVKCWSPVVAALLSFLVPGLGQVYKGQVLNGIVWFILVAVGYFALVIPGLILHACCIIGAALGDPYR